MKCKQLVLLVLVVISLPAFSQHSSRQFKAAQLNDVNLSAAEQQQLTDHDFAKLFTSTDNTAVYGFIGNNYQRIRIKFLSVKKKDSHHYEVSGKSMVKGNICDFKGLLTITNIRSHKNISAGLDNAYKNKGIQGEYAIIGDYLFNEDNRQPHTGMFKGSFRSDLYLTKAGQIHYDDINREGTDGYKNNQFAGGWTSYKDKTAKPCNWGDYRIPQSGNLDGGAGEFSPADKYLSAGWQSVHDAYVSGPNSAKAKQEENRAWWK